MIAAARAQRALRLRRGARVRHAAALVVATLLSFPAAAAEYVPPRGDWETRAPAAAGFDPARLSAALEYAQSNTVVEPSDLRLVLDESFGSREPGYRILGPVKPRAGGSGMIVRGGRVVAQWGDVERPDMPFSVAKSLLATVAGVAFADGRLRDLDGRVARDVDGPWFDGEHNGAITWRHLLDQSSDWRGTLWDVPDWADRPTGATLKEWRNQPLAAPGTRFEYNDVRINLLALALLHVLREPLPQVLRERVLDPIGASNTWRWHGYENSWIELDGQRMQSVSGGGHFGGGFTISTADLARFGLLALREGRWGERQVLPRDWFVRMRAPSAAKPDYGLLWWLNVPIATDGGAPRRAIPGAPESAYWAAGFGGNFVYVDEANDLVIVLRWIPEGLAVVGRIVDALRTPVR